MKLGFYAGSSLAIFSAIIVNYQYIFDSYKEKITLLEVFECNIMNLATKLLGVVSPHDFHDFDMWNIG